MPLRNEDYVAFLDESGRGNLQVVAGVLIPARWLRGADRRWRDFVSDQLGSRSGRVEIKSRDLLAGKGVSRHAQTRIKAVHRKDMSVKAAGHMFYRRTLEHIAGISEIRLVVVGVESVHPLDAYRLWFWMTYAALVQHKTAPRPRLPVVVIDGQDASFRDAQDLIAYRFYRSFPRVQPYVGAGSDWFVGGALHHDSATLPFIQMADLVAGAARVAIEGHTRYGDWFDSHLRAPGKPRHRNIDISAHALRCLGRLAPDDSCGSAWKSARLVP